MACSTVSNRGGSPSAVAVWPRRAPGRPRGRTRARRARAPGRSAAPRASAPRRRRPRATVSASMTTRRRAGRGQRATRSRTKSALPKNNGPSTRTTSAAGSALRVVVLVGVDPQSGGVRHPAEDGHVRPRGARDQQDQRDHDADDQAGQGVEDQHSHHGRDGRDEVGPAREVVDRGEPPGLHAVEATQRGDVDQLDDGGDHHRGERRLGQLLEEPGEEEQGDDRQHGGREAGELRLAPAPPFTAVFDRLPFTTMPLARPAPRLAIPRPISSRLLSMS